MKVFKTNPAEMRTKGMMAVLIQTQEHGGGGHFLCIMSNNRKIGPGDHLRYVGDECVEEQSEDYAKWAIENSPLFNSFLFQYFLKNSNKPT